LGDAEGADLCRSQCIGLIPIIDEYAENQTLVVMKADLLRRIGCFEEIISEYKDIKMEDELLQKIVDFQVEKAMKKDTAKVELLGFI